MARTSWRTLRLRRALVLAIEQAISTLDALDAETEDLEDSHDQEAVDEREPEEFAIAIEYPDPHDQTQTGGIIGWAS